MNDAQLMRDANYIAESMIKKYGWQRSITDARRRMCDQNMTRHSRLYWMRVVLCLEELKPTGKTKCSTEGA